MIRDLDTDLVAALLWDSGTLLTSERRGARAFWNAMKGLPIDREMSDVPDDDALGIAAQSVRSWFGGDRDKAELLALKLLDHSEWASILGYSLLFWMGATSPAERWTAAARTVRAVEDTAVRSHLLTKLFLLAFDAEDSPLAQSFLAEAEEIATGSLRRQLQVLATNLYGSSLRVESTVYEGDDLVDLPWVVTAAMRAARDAISDLANQHVASLGMQSQRFGNSPISRLWIAESQATWAGAMWVRDSVRELIAPLILLNSPEDEEDARSTVEIWITRKGQNLSAVVEHVEPWFGPDTANRILRTDLRSQIELDQSVSEIAAGARAMWDLVDEATATWLLKSLPPPRSDDVRLRNVLPLWTLFAMRFPESWLPAYQSLRSEERRAVARTFSAEAPKHLSEPAVNAILEAIGRDVVDEDVDLVVSALSMLGRPTDEFIDRLATAQPDTVISLLDADPALVPDRVIELASGRLLERIRSDAESARLGSYSLGGQDPRWQLGRLGSTGRGPTHAIRQALLKNAMSDTKGRLRIGALRGLLAMAQEGLLTSNELAALRFAPRRGDSTDRLLGATSDLLATLQISILSIASDTPAHVPDLLVLTRAPDAEARALAVRTVGRIGDSLSIELVAPTLLGALFDRSPDVIVEALRALDVSRFSDSDWLPSLKSRVLALQEQGTRRIRAEVAALASRLDDPAKSEPWVAHLAKRANGDRSWLVRIRGQD